MIFRRIQLDLGLLDLKLCLFYANIRLIQLLLRGIDLRFCLSDTGRTTARLAALQLLILRIRLIGTAFRLLIQHVWNRSFVCQLLRLLCQLLSLLILFLSCFRCGTRLARFRLNRLLSEFYLLLGIINTSLRLLLSNLRILQLLLRLLNRQLLQLHLIAAITRIDHCDRGSFFTRSPLETFTDASSPGTLEITGEESCRGGSSDNLSLHNKIPLRNR